MEHITISQDVADSIFFASNSGNDFGIYYDMYLNDAVQYIQGYFISLTEDNQTEIRRNLVKRIENFEPHDYFDKERYFKMPRTTVHEFIDSFIRQANHTYPFDVMAEQFKINNKKETHITEEILSEFERHYRDFFRGKATPEKSEIVYSLLVNGTIVSLVTDWINKKAI